MKVTIMQKSLSNFCTVILSQVFTSSKYNFTQTFTEIYILLHFYVLCYIFILFPCLVAMLCPFHTLQDPSVFASHVYAFD